MGQQKRDAAADDFFLIASSTVSTSTPTSTSEAEEIIIVYSGDGDGFPGPTPPPGWPHGYPPPPSNRHHSERYGHHDNEYDHPDEQSYSVSTPCTTTSASTSTDSVVLPPYKDWDGASSSYLYTIVDSDPTSFVTDLTTVTDTFYSSPTSSSSMTATAAAQVGETTFPRPPPPSHSPLKFILLGAFLGAGAVLAILGCIFCARRVRKTKKRLRKAEERARDAEGGASLPMAETSTTRLTTAMAPSAGTESNVTRRVEYAHRESRSPHDDPVIINPFSDPAYNASSGLDDYIVASPATADIGLNPFSHPDDHNAAMECESLLQPNSDGDFPPEYMTIDNDGVGGMGPRESRFPFGDDALSDSSSIRNNPRLLGGATGFGDGFRGYVPGQGLGAELGEGMGEGFSGHIPDSDTATLTDEQRSTQDVGSIRESMLVDYPGLQRMGSMRESMIQYPRLSQDSQQPSSNGVGDGFDDGFVADGFGYRPGMGGIH